MLQNSKKLKFKYPPISELVNNVQMVLKIEKVLNLAPKNKDIIVIKTKNYNKIPKYRFFLAVLLANQSSDYLVILAKNNLNFKDDYKLIQYPIFPQYHRIGLLCLLEIKTIDQIDSSLDALKLFKTHFREKLEDLKNI